MLAPQVWQLPGGQLRTTLQQEESVSCCAISPNGQALVTGHINGDVMVRDPLTGKVRTTLEGHEEPVAFCTISPNGRLLVTGRHHHDDNKDDDGSDANNGDNDQDCLKVWDLSTDMLWPSSLGPVTTPTSCIFSPDMSLAIAAGGQSDCFHVWDLPSRQLRAKLEGARSVSCCAISPDGQTLVSGSKSNNTLTVWDLPAALKEPKGEKEPVDEQKPASAQVCRLLCCAVSSHSLVLGWNDKPQQVWDLPSGQPHMMEKEPVCCCAISPDGQTLARGSSGNWLTVWDLPSCRLRTTLEWECHPKDCCIISSDGKTLVAACLEGKLGDNDDDDGSCSQESQRSPQKGQLHVWDLPTGQLHTQLSHKGGTLSCCAISADGRWLVSGSSLSIKVWDLPTGKECAALVGGAGAQCCAISPDGRLVVCGFHREGGSESHNIKVWDLATGRVRMALQGHYSNITWCTISLDGKTMTSCSYAWNADKAKDQAVQVWDLLAGTEESTVEQMAGLLTHKEQSKVEQKADHCALGPDGQLLVFASALDKLKAWVLMGNWQQGPAPQAYTETMSLHRWCPGAPGYYLL